MERAADIMRVLAAQPRGYRLAELARSLGLAKATVHGILRTLRQAGLVEQDTATGQYRLGAALLHLGSRYLDGNELRTQALGWADSLATRTGESVRIGSLYAGGVLIVHHVPQPGGSRQISEVGALLPAHSTALGKALLAGDTHAVPNMNSLDGRPLERFTRRTVATAAELRAQLAEVAARGWAADIEETIQGEASIAAAIRDRHGRTVGAIGITGAIERLTDKGRPRNDLVAAVRETARALERDFAPPTHAPGIGGFDATALEGPDATSAAVT